MIFEIEGWETAEAKIASRASGFLRTKVRRSSLQISQIRMVDSSGNSFPLKEMLWD